MKDETLYVYGCDAGHKVYRGTDEPPCCYRLQCDGTKMRKVATVARNEGESLEKWQVRALRAKEGS